MKQQNKVFIHIGLEKTGTTSLQEFFHVNRQLLESKYNFYFPKTPGLKNHTDLPLFAYREKLGDLPLRKGITEEKDLEKFREKFKTQFLKEIKPYAEKGYNILISNEHLSSRGGLDKEGIARLIDLFKGIGLRYKVIIYLRRQDQFLLSTYSTRIKSGGTDEFNKRAFRRKRYNYKALLDVWSDVVGKENMVVGIFQKEKWKDQNLYADFFKKIGIHEMNGFEIPPRDSNKSMDIDQLEFLVTFNKLVPEFIDGQPNPLRGEVIPFLEKYTTGNKQTFNKRYINKVTEFFKEDNDSIVAEYMEDKDSPLFAMDSINKENEQNNPELTVEKVVEIAAQLWQEQQQVINEIKSQQFSSKNIIKEMQGKIEEKKRVIQRIVRGGEN